MTKVDKLLKEYSKSHQNWTNKVIHYFCVPLIMLSIIGILMNITVGTLNLALVAVVLVSIYYLFLSRKYFAFMIIIFTLMYFVNLYIAQRTNLLFFSIGLFIISWIFQFVGHKIEGKKPSFLEDLLFLLIGPLWVAKSLFRIKS